MMTVWKIYKNIIHNLDYAVTTFGTDLQLFSNVCLHK